MTTISEKLVLLSGTKGAIRTAIEAKGITVPAILPFADYPAKIAEISAGGTAISWNRPADWIDISAVNDNEINLLVTEGTGIAFIVTVSGTFSIDWGDGTTELNCTSGSIRQHQHTVNGTSCSQGYHTWKIRIYGATSSITRFVPWRHSYTTRVQNSPLLEAVFGTAGITSFSGCFYLSNLKYFLFKSCTITSLANCTTTVNMFVNCYSLVSVVLPSSWGSVTSVSAMFSNCNALTTVVLPMSWGNVLNTANMFSSCTSLLGVILPSDWGAVSYITFMFNGCSNLAQIILPSSWGLITSTQSMFSYSGSSLTTIILPSNWGNVTNVSYMFYSCNLAFITLPAAFGNVTTVAGMFDYNYSLKSIVNVEFLGSQSVNVDFSPLMTDCDFVQQNMTIGSLLSRLGIFGISTVPLKLNSLRLSNPGSTFAGATPHVNVAYTSLGAAALDLLFGDLPVLTGKTILITGCTGAATCNRSIATAKGWTVTG